MLYREEETTVPLRDTRELRGMSVYMQVMYQGNSLSAERVAHRQCRR